MAFDSPGTTAAKIAPLAVMDTSYWTNRWRKPSVVNGIGDRGKNGLLTRFS
jgi:hypothetical protein